MRIDSLRDGFIPCYAHKEWTPPQCSQKKFGNVIMAKVADIFQNRWAQVRELPDRMSASEGEGVMEKWT